MNIEAIRTFIQAEILNEPDFQIGDDEDLLLSEILDSLRVALLIAHLEEATNAHIPPEDVTLENFSTLRSIEDYLRRLTGSGDRVD